MQINEVLEQTPSKKAKSSEEAEGLRQKWQEAKEVYANDEAKEVLLLKVKNEDIKTTEIKYYINANEDLYEKRLELIVLEAHYRHKEKEIEALDDEFTSAKMLARIKISELGSLEWPGK